MSDLIELLMEIRDVLKRMESHLYHIEKHCRPDDDRTDESPARRERTL